jgi:YihY family inner membrane protein
MSAPSADLPHGPTDLPGTSWWAAVRRSVREFQRDNVTDWAAALTYYSVLSIFPAMLVIVSLVGLAGKSVSRSLVTNVGELAPGQVKQILMSAIEELQRSHGGAGVVAIIGLGAAIWSSSGYVGAFMRASNAIYDIGEGRPIYKTLPIRIAITLTTLILLSVCATAVVISGPIARHAGEMVGAGSAAITIFGIVKWPILLFIAGFLFSMLYWAAPNAKQKFRWVTPGGVLAIVIWLIASAGFAFYVANFGSYNKTYGSLAGLIIFLVWAWITNIAILLGAELNAELERGRAIAAGHPKTEEPYVELRDERALDNPPDN